MLEFQRRLQRSPYFSSVIVDVDVNGPSEGAPIRVQVTEAKTKRVAYGLGFSTDTGARLEVTYRQSLLFGKPYTLSTGASLDPTRAAGLPTSCCRRMPMTPWTAWAYCGRTRTSRMC